MNAEPVVVERTFDAPVSAVWQALTDNDKMKQWYFNLAEFKAEPGFKFNFSGGEEGGKQYYHECIITEVIPEKKLAYSWRYPEYEGTSLVNFELFAEGDKTRVKITHTGLESFDSSNDPSFAKESFEKGWTYILGTSLKAYLEQ